jgi:hypothetical protein
MVDESASSDDAITEYKTLVRSLIDKRPSGTRQKLADAFGTHKSFVSQVTNPAYRVPLPAQHIPALMKVCHFNEEESAAFLNLYKRAHPGQAGSIEELASINDHVLHIPIPDLGSPDKREEVEMLIQEFASKVIALAMKK